MAGSGAVGPGKATLDIKRQGLAKLEQGEREGHRRHGVASTEFRAISGHSPHYTVMIGQTFHHFPFQKSNIQMRDAWHSILLSEAIETADASGTLVSHSARRMAIGNLQPPAQSNPNMPTAYDFFQRRAKLIVREVPKEIVDRANDFRSALHRVTWVGVCIAAVSLVLGLGSHQLGYRGSVNVLSFPLLGLIAWNFVIYVTLVLRPVLWRGGPNLIAALVTCIRRVADRFAMTRTPRQSTPESQSLWRYFENAARVEMPFLRARLQTWFHLSAVLFATGAVGGMYWDGLATKYEAKWESTFITTSDSAKRFFDTIFAPASVISGLRTPNEEEIELAADGKGPAARWIHLYAVTALLFIGLPRLVLALVSHLTPSENRVWREEILEQHRDYFARLLSPVASRNAALAVVVPHRLKIDGQQRVAIRDLLARHFEEIDFRQPSVDYGTEENWAASFAPPVPAECLVLAMSFSATPEEDSQGILVEGAQNWLRTNRPKGRLLVLLDRSEFEVRMRSLPEAESRLKQRKAAWERFFNGYGLQFSFVQDVNLDEKSLWRPSTGK